jgi:hypothetical protein
MILKLTIAIASCCVLDGCVSRELREVDMTPPQAYEVTQSENELLDIGIAVFDSNVPDEYDERVLQFVQPEIRAAEANYMPYFARTLLESTGNWGSVRVVPRDTHAVDVMVSGRILHSDGESIRLELSVTDARGRQWFVDQYEALASRYAYDDAVPEDVDPFQAVYVRLADDLLDYRRTLSVEDVLEIRATAEMQFARDFLPDAFSEFLRRDAETGEFQLMRLPARHDPNMQRVRRLRDRERLFIDTLEAHYEVFGRRMYPPYQSWREATYEEAIAVKELEKQAREQTIAALAALASLSGIGYASERLEETRNEAAIRSEVLQEIGVEAGAEVLPYTLELENESLRLQGTVEEQYDQLRELLRAAYYDDMGLKAADRPEY